MAVLVWDMTGSSLVKPNDRYNSWLADGLSSHEDSGAWRSASRGGATLSGWCGFRRELPLAEGRLHALQLPLQERVAAPSGLQPVSRAGHLRQVHLALA